MKKATPYLLLAPALLFTVFILVYPLLQNLLNSFRDVSLLRSESSWTGLHNFADILSDDLVWLALKNTVIYALLGTVLSMLVGLGFAMLLNRKAGRSESIYEFLYAIPWVLSPVVAGFVWKWLLNDNFGIINYWLLRTGLIHENITWLGSSATALFCVSVARVWQFYPFAMLMFLAGLKTIPQEQYEAAAVDGAKPVQRFLNITLPNLRPVTTVLLLLGIIWSFNDFNMVFVMTRGGPVDSSMVLPVLVREFSFVHFDLGKGSALSMLIFATLLALSLLYVRTITRRESV